MKRLADGVAFKEFLAVPFSIAFVQQFRVRGSILFYVREAAPTSQSQH
jgi:hypothetical protein